MNDFTLPLSGLSSVGGKAVVARFDGGMLSSDSGVLALAEVEKRLRVADRLARCINDPRCPDQTVHSLADMIGFRMKMIAAGYEGGNDANRLRSDPVFEVPRMRCLRVGIWPPSRRCAGWRTCLACGNWSLWAGRWSTFTALPSARCQNGSCLTLMTPLTPCMAASNCGSSMPITTNICVNSIQSTATESSDVGKHMPGVRPIKSRHGNHGVDRTA